MVQSWSYDKGFEYQEHVLVPWQSEFKNEAVFMSKLQAIFALQPHIIFRLYGMFDFMFTPVMRVTLSTSLPPGTC